MGGDDSQKLLPWRGAYFPSGARLTSGSLQNQYFNSWLSETSRPMADFGAGPISQRNHLAVTRAGGSFLESRGGPLLASP